MTSSARSSRRFKPGRAETLTLALCVAAALCVGAYVSAKRAAPRAVVIDNPDGSRSTLSVEPLAGLEFFNPRAGRAEPLALTAEKTLVVLLSAGDCPTCLDERRVWEELARSADPQQFGVVGLLVRTSPAEAQTFIKAYDPSFTVLLDTGGEIARRTQLPQFTPFKLLVNSRGEILMADGPNNKPPAQEAFRGKVAAQIGPARAAR